MNTQQGVYQNAHPGPFNGNGDISGPYTYPEPPSNGALPNLAGSESPYQQAHHGSINMRRTPQKPAPMHSNLARPDTAAAAGAAATLTLVELPTSNPNDVQFGLKRRYEGHHVSNRQWIPTVAPLTAVMRPTVPSRPTESQAVIDLTLDSSDSETYAPPKPRERPRDHMTYDEFNARLENRRADSTSTQPRTTNHSHRAPTPAPIPSHSPPTSLSVTGEGVANKRPGHSSGDLAYLYGLVDDDGAGPEWDFVTAKSSRENGNSMASREASTMADQHNRHQPNQHQPGPSHIAPFPAAGLPFVEDQANGTRPIQHAHASSPVVIDQEVRPPKTAENRGPLHVIQELARAVKRRDENARLSKEMTGGKSTTEKASTPADVVAEVRVPTVVEKETRPHIGVEKARSTDGVTEKRSRDSINGVRPPETVAEPANVQKVIDVEPEPSRATEKGMKRPQKSLEEARRRKALKREARRQRAAGEARSRKALGHARRQKAKETPKPLEQSEERAVDVLDRSKVTKAVVDRGSIDDRSALLDAHIYSQEGARTPPSGVSINREDTGLFETAYSTVYLRTNPRIHGMHHRSEAWEQRKAEEIRQRPRRKHWFGNPGRRSKWLQAHKTAEEARRQKLSDPPPPKEPEPWTHQTPADFASMREEDLPSDVKENPAWLRICARMREDKAIRHRTMSAAEATRRRKEEVKKREEADALAKAREQQKEQHREVARKQARSEVVRAMEEIKRNASPRSKTATYSMPS